MIRRLFALAACCAGPAFAAPPAECARFLGDWSGQWSQGFYGTQRIHITHVSDQCVATLAYSPTEAPPERSQQIPIEGGAMTFRCSTPGSVCRLEVKDDTLRATVTVPSGFVNEGVFRRDR